MSEQREVEVFFGDTAFRLVGDYTPQTKAKGSGPWEDDVPDSDAAFDLQEVWVGAESFSEAAAKLFVKATFSLGVRFNTLWEVLRWDGLEKLEEEGVGE